MLRDLSNGQASFGQAFGPSVLVLLILSVFLLPVAIAAQTRNRFMAQSIALPLTSSDSKALCMECDGPLTQSQTGLWNCQHCKTPHFIPLAFDQAEATDLLKRLAQSKELGHLAASRACKAHDVSVTAGAKTYKYISRSLLIATPILALALVGSGTATTGESLGLTIFAAGFLGGFSGILGRMKKTQAVHDATFSKVTVGHLQRLT